MNWREHIEQRPDVMTGKPVIKGTRITVESILERLGDGWTVEEILGAYPDLDRVHIRAALAFAAAYLALEETIFS
jgi:uncharacterized protein (DUF433 family)